jgi:hypothetical protein
MGRIRDILLGIKNKASNYLDNDSENTYTKEVSTIQDSSSPSDPPPYTMPQGYKLNPEELIEENKTIIQKVDPKIDSIINMLDELDTASDEDLLDLFAREPFMMKTWLAHTAYKNRIDSFHNLICPKTSKYPTKDFKTKSIDKKIKCITDLPLQKKLLN